MLLNKGERENTRELRAKSKPDLTNYEEKVDEITTKKKFFEACWVLQHFALKVSDREIETHFFEKKKNLRLQTFKPTQK